MSGDDPFSFDDDKTIILPTPGGRRPAKLDTPEPARAATPIPDGGDAGRVARAALFTKLAAGGSQNPIIAAAMPLLSLAGRLRNTPVMSAVENLQRSTSEEIREFENRMLTAGVAPDQIKMAHYALCTFLDETVLNTPWGAQSFWGHRSLLVLFHGEAWGGERFFDICNKALRQPASYQYLIEFCYVLLSLGFLGRYRQVGNGLHEIERLRAELYRLIQQLRGDPEPELSPRWQGVRDLRPALMRYVPFWVVGTTAAVVLLLTYLGLAFMSDSASDPAYKQLLTLHNDVFTPAGPSIAQVKAAVAGRGERFRRLLATEIQADMVEVIDDNVLRVRNSFLSGSDRVKPEFLPMLKKIAGELRDQQDQVLVTGHTDDKPMVSARFPSNWHLSDSRAKHVAEILRADVSGGVRIRSEGRADGEPLAPNDTAEQRAQNRRVDILIR